MYVVAVLAIGVQTENGATELSQRTTLPVCPASINTALVLPVQIVVPPLTAPPTVVGETLIKKVTGVPVQPSALGVTVTVAVPTVGVNAGMAVTPICVARPTAPPPVMSKVTPDGVPTSATGVVVIPAHRSIVAGAVAVGTGLTVTVTLAVLGQPKDVAVAVYDCVEVGAAYTCCTAVPV